MHRRPYALVAVVALVVAAALSYAAPARAQDTTAAPGTQATQPPPDMPEGKAPAAESDLMLIDLPTTLSLKRHHSYFRLTHRFARDLRRGDLGELASDLFSLDNGAIIGFEYRFGITSTIQAGVHRSMLSKTIQTFGRWDAVAQGERSPIGASLTLSVEGLDNMQQHIQPAVAITISRIVGGRLALYASPAFVGSTYAVDVIEGHR